MLYYQKHCKVKGLGLLPAISAYLKDNADHGMIIEKWDEINKIPIFIQNISNLYRLSFFGVQCIILEITGSASGVDTLQKAYQQHWEYNRPANCTRLPQ